MNLNDEYAAFAERCCPARPFFLEEDFLRRTFPIAQLPPEKLPETIAVAGQFRENSRLRFLAWRYYQDLCVRGSIYTFTAYPDVIDGLDAVFSGFLHIIIALTLIPSLEERAEREHFPLRYAHDAATRIGTSLIYFARAHNGAFGILGATLKFMLGFREAPMFRIGRFDFVLCRAAQERFPEMYRTSDGKIIAFCNQGWHITKEGLYHYGKTLEESEREAGFSDDGNTVRGTRIDLKTALADDHETELPRAGLTRIVHTGDWLLDYHIPSGGGMKPELCRQSFREALEFFSSCYPDKPVKAIFSTSWIFNPAWLDYLPNSNMTSLIRMAHLYPSASQRPGVDKAGFSFIFGRTDDDFATYPQNNSLEKALLQCFRDGRLRPAGMILLPGEV